MEGPGFPPGAAPADVTSRPPPRRRVVIKRKVSSKTYERHKEHMENLGLDPSDPLPPQSEQFLDMAEDDNAPDPELPYGSPMPSPARGARLSISSQVPPPKAKERKTVSLKTRTLEEQIVAKRYDRALERFAQQQEEWEKFRHHASRKTGRDKEELVVTRAEEYRERLEVMELLDRATPEEIKSGGFNWYHSLRGEGTRFIQVGNMFSGLYLPMKLHKEKFVHEIIRKPLLVDLTTARHAAEASGKKKPRSWRDDEYLLTRIRKYGAKMKELAPGQLEYDELMEVEAKPLRPAEDEMRQGLPEEELMAALLEEGPGADHTQPLEQEASTSPVAAPIQGPHAEVTPKRLHFQAEVKKMCTRTVRLRNSGTAAIQFQWVQNPPPQGFQESALPQDPTQHFTCHQTSGRVLPGGDVQTMFSFTAAAPGTFKSSWCLQTYPQLIEPIVDLPMNGSAIVADLHWERRAALQVHMVKEQTVSLASELAEDIVAAAGQLVPPPLPDISQPTIQERLFEEANAAEGLHWSPLTWQTFSALQEKVESLVPPVLQADGGEEENRGFQPPPGARGHKPVPKVEPPSAAEPLTPMEQLHVPSFSRMRAQIDKLQVEPGAARSEKAELTRQLERAKRTARQRPLERSPVWWHAYETITEIASMLPVKWAATRQRNGLEPLPFLAPLAEDASPEEVEEYNQKLEDRKAKLAPEEKEAEVRDIFCRGFMKNKFGPACARFGVTAKEAAVMTRMAQAGSLSLGDRIRPCLGRVSSEAVELSGNVVLYELDLGLLTPPSCEEATKPLAVADGDLEVLKQRFRGVASVLEAAPLAVLVTMHLGVPVPDKLQESADDTEAPRSELDEVQARMASLASVEPLLEVLREVVGAAATAVEFVPHEVWLGPNQDFTQKVRNEEVENKVFLLENMSAVAEETGIRRTLQAPVEGQGDEETDSKVAVHALPWATREGWAARTFADIQPESFVQDALAQSCQSTTLSTGLWPRAPQRIIGPSIEAELADFLETMQLPIRGSAAEEAAATAELGKSAAVDEDGKETIPAPLLVVLGGGFGAEGREEVLLKKLELLIGLSRFAEYEKGGVHVFAGGELASCILSGVLSIPMGMGSVSDGAMIASLREALLEVMRMDVSISLPLDLMCEVPEGEEPPGEPQDTTGGFLVPLAAAWKQAASAPVFLGYSNCRECYISVDVQHGVLHLRRSEPGEMPAGTGDQASAEEVAETETSAFSTGIPDKWIVRDIGPATTEQMRSLLRRSRGAIWNGSLGCYEDGRWQKGTQEFISMLEARLTGAGEDEEEEEDEEDEEEDEEDEGEADDEEAKPRKEPKQPKERPAEFEVAAVLGRDSRHVLANMAENPAHVSFLSGTGEGLLQVLRGGPLPGVLSCMKTEST